jgi:hypothetical protein
MKIPELCDARLQVKVKNALEKSTRRANFHQQHLVSYHIAIMHVPLLEAEKRMITPDALSTLMQYVCLQGRGDGCSCIISN